MKDNNLEEIILEETDKDCRFQEHENNCAMEKTESSKKLMHRVVRGNLFRFLVAVIILCACAGLGAGLAVMEDKSDPTDLVAGYFGKFLMQDYEDMIKYVDTTDTFFTKDSFVNLMSDLRLAHNIGEYEFGKVKKEGGRYIMCVSYKDAETGEDQYFDIYLKKNRKNITQFISDWKISIEDYLVQDYVVQIPEGMTLELDGVEVTNQSEGIKQMEIDVIKTADGETIVINGSAENTGNNMTYKISNIIRGPHRLKATSEFTQIVKDIDVTSDNQNNVLNVSEETIRDDYLKIIETHSVDMVQEFYKVVRNRKTSSDTLKAYFINDENLLKSLKKELERSQKIIYWPDTKNIEDYSLVQCNFSEVQYTAQYMGENKIKAIYTFSYDYVSSTSTTLYDSYVSSISGTCNTAMEIVYTIENEEMKISDISIKNKNKKNVEEE